MDSNISVSTLKNYVENKLIQKQKQEVFYIRLKIVNLIVVPFQVELHKRNSIVGQLLRRTQEIHIPLPSLIQ